MMYLLPTARKASKFAKLVGCGIAGKTGRHTYNEWDAVLQKRGNINRKMDAFYHPANKGCRMRYRADMLPKSLDILNRTVQIDLSPLMTPDKVTAGIRKVKKAAKAVLR